ncbi:hypothetical protein [Peribacillus frigoritolerans]|uniref:hypothetical protein n=1 Tax=Peribacillus frigoritolerans TaxID=450367 RepID=UPI0038095AD0
MTDQQHQLTDELKVLMDQYNNGELNAENLRRLKNMLYILGDDVSNHIEQLNKIKKRDLYVTN